MTLGLSCRRLISPDILFFDAPVLQGFPNWDPPEFVVAAAQKALSEGFHQYTRTAGHPRLVQLLSKRYSKHFGREVDAFSQVEVIGRENFTPVFFVCFMPL